MLEQKDYEWPATLTVPTLAAVGLLIATMPSDHHREMNTVLRLSVAFDVVQQVGMQPARFVFRLYVFL